jgi:hypothetical protein
MSNLNLTLTSEQICDTLAQSYDRLSQNYVGPTSCTDDPQSGFHVKNAFGSDGLTVGNSFFDFYSNCLNFDKTNSNLQINLFECTNLHISGCNSSLFFDFLGNLAIGSPNIDQDYNGLQVYNNNPSLVLYEKDCNPDHLISFKSDTLCDVFFICQSGYDESIINANCNLKLVSNGNNSLNVSGLHVSFNSPLHSGYNFYYSGCSFHNGDYNFLGATSFCGDVNVCSTGIAMIVSGESMFLSNTLFCGETIFTAPMSVQNCFDAQRAAIDSATIQYLDVTSTIVSPIVSNTCYAEFLGIALINCSTSNYGFFKELAFTYGTGENLHVSGCIDLSGDLNLFNTGETCINSKNLTIELTGNCNQFTICSPCVNLNGFLYADSGVYTKNLYLTGSGDFNVSGCLHSLCSQTNMLNVCNCLCALSLTVGTSTNTNSIQACCFCQTNSGEVSCFASDVLNIGSCSMVKVVSGQVNSLNTAKSWGLFSLCSGAVVGFSGFNFTGVSNPLYLNGYSGCLAQTNYALKLIDPVKAPFSASFTIVNTIHATGILQDTTQVRTCDLIVPSVILLNCGSSLQNPAVWSDYKQICMGCCYHELLFTTIAPVGHTINVFHGCITYTIFGS